jgi:hypothetical protein
MSRSTRWRSRLHFVAQESKTTPRKMTKTEPPPTEIGRHRFQAMRPGERTLRRAVQSSSVTRRTTTNLYWLLLRNPATGPQRLAKRLEADDGDGAAGAVGEAARAIVQSQPRALGVSLAS